MDEIERNKIMKSNIKKFLCIIIATAMLCSLGISAFSHNDPVMETSAAVYMSAEDKIAFAKEKDAIYAAQAQPQNISANPVTRHTEVRELIKQAVFAPESEKEGIREELACYGIYEFEGQIIDSPDGQTRSSSGDVNVHAPTIFYDSSAQTWTVSCSGGWRTNNWDTPIFPALFGNVGGEDGFGIGFTSLAGTYTSYVMDSYAEIHNGEIGGDYKSETTRSRSDGDGSKGFGFRLQDSVVPNSVGLGSYVGKFWYGYCTYSQNFQNYSGVATGYYAHTWSQTIINSVSFGYQGAVAGVQVGFSNNEKSFVAYGTDKRF